MVFLGKSVYFKIIHCNFLVKGGFALLFILFIQFGTYHKIPINQNNVSFSTVEEELIVSVEKIVNAGGNHYRKKAIIKQLSSFGLEENTRQERIDWLSVQKNIIVDIPGESDSLIYVVAHYDKTDANPLKAASIFLNGLLDPLISWSYTTQGAIDNATGVAVALQLAKSIAERNNNSVIEYYLLDQKNQCLEAHERMLPDCLLKNFIESSLSSMLTSLE